MQRAILFALALLVFALQMVNVLLCLSALMVSMKRAARASLTTASQMKHVLMVSVFLGLNVQQDKRALTVFAKRPSVRNAARLQVHILLIRPLPSLFVRVAALSPL